MSSTTKAVNALVIKLFMLYFMHHIIDYLVVKVKIKKCLWTKKDIFFNIEITYIYSQILSSQSSYEIVFG